MFCWETQGSSHSCGHHLSRLTTPNTSAIQAHPVMAAGELTFVPPGKTMHRATWQKMSQDWSWEMQPPSNPRNLPRQINSKFVTSHRCLMGPGAGTFGDQVNALSSLSHSLGCSWAVFAAGHVVLLEEATAIKEGLYSSQDYPNDRCELTIIHHKGHMNVCEKSWQSI